MNNIRSCDTIKTVLFKCSVTNNIRNLSVSPERDFCAFFETFVNVIAKLVSIFLFDDWNSSISLNMIYYVDNKVQLPFIII